MNTLAVELFIYGLEPTRAPADICCSYESACHIERGRFIDLENLLESLQNLKVFIVNTKNQDRQKRIGTAMMRFQKID